MNEGKKGKTPYQYTSSLCPTTLGFYSPHHRSLAGNITRVSAFRPAHCYFLNVN